MQYNFDIIHNEEIVDKLIKGDEETFAMVYKSCFIPLKNYAASIVSDQEAAYEIVQNLFVSLWENRRKLNRDKILRNYLLRGTHNNSLRYLKTLSLHQWHQEQIKQETSREKQADTIGYGKLSAPESRLETLLDSLPERGRQVVVMSYIENKKNAEIARQLGISVRTVETILYQTLKKLRIKAKK